MNATETKYTNLMKNTVAELKSMAKSMDAPINSRMVKADIVNAIMVKVELDHVKAIEDEAFRNETASPVKTFSGMTVMDRLRAYRKDNKRFGGLTARQNRRILKKYKRALGKGFSLEIVVGA